MNKIFTILLAAAMTLLCFGCGSSDSSYDDSYDDSYDYSAVDDYYDEDWEEPEPALEAEEFPADGAVLEGSAGSTSKISITASSSESCYVRLKNDAGETVLGFFVNAGSTVTVGVPGQSLTVYFAMGNTWYGLEHLFGDGTSYSKDDNPVDFSQYTIEYDLSPVVDGNFQQTTVDEDEF